MTHPFLTAVADQHAAATREQVGFLHQLAPLIGGTPEHLQEPPPRLNERLEALSAAILDGRLRDCGHLTGPRPTFVALWDDQMVCAGCTWRISRLDGREDRTCDLCGAYRPSGVLPCFVQHGALVVIYGACPTCQADCERTAA